MVPISAFVTEYKWTIESSSRLYNNILNILEMLSFETKRFGAFYGY